MECAKGLYIPQTLITLIKILFYCF